MEVSDVLIDKHIKIEKIFLILASIFGVITMFVQPLLSVPDESVHFRHSYAIFHGDAREENFKGFSDLDRVAVQESYSNGSFVDKYIISKRDYKDNPLSFNLHYRRIQYLPQAIGILIGERIYPSLGVVMGFGRLINLIFYIVCMYFAIKKAKFAQWFMAIVALFPISIQQAASLSYDSFFFVAIFITFSLITNLLTRKEPLTLKWYGYILSSIILLFLAKTSALAMGLYFVTLPMALFGSKHFTAIIEKIYLLCNKYKKAITFLCILLFILFLKHEFSNQGGLLKGVQVLLNTFTRPDFATDLDSTMTTGIIGSFGYLEYRLPEWVVIINFIFLFLIGVSDKHIVLKKRVVVASGLIYFLNIVLVSLIMYFEWTIGFLKYYDVLVVMGNQGRYYTPFLVCLAPICIFLQKYIKVEITEVTKKRMYIVLSIFNLAFFIILTLLRYYTKDAGYNFLPQFGEWLRSLI